VNQLPVGCEVLGDGDVVIVLRSVNAAIMIAFSN